MQRHFDNLTSNIAKGENAQYVDTLTTDRCHIRIRLKQAPRNKDKAQNNNISTSAERKRQQNREKIKKLKNKKLVTQILEASTQPQSDNKDYGADIPELMVPTLSSSKTLSGRKRVKRDRSMPYRRLHKVEAANLELRDKIDFSENYVTKYSTEIQATHFGASKRQISFHTGLHYVRDKQTRLVKSKSCCTVSDNLNHQAHGVWAHLEHTLKELSAEYPNTDTNYNGNGHGKGPMDGVDGALKRKGDGLVLRDGDITSAFDFVYKLQGSAIKM
ncbi:hypothetical protein ILUMI_18981 [Ignelater luminosus]|uniref:Uncharacterized protein n=1 Tax=Ignelater luminosus TaxID=2038154 RepID=A0A8K0CL16_IGNLU|nr:hypothetical protein ILUMI_18981 [Ignelater luminosus]